MFDLGLRGLFVLEIDLDREKQTLSVHSPGTLLVFFAFCFPPSLTSLLSCYSFKLLSQVVETVQDVVDVLDRRNIPVPQECLSVLREYFQLGTMRSKAVQAMHVSCSVSMTRGSNL